MRTRPLLVLLPALIGGALAFATVPARAQADLIGTALDQPAPDLLATITALGDYLNRRAALLLIRASYGVVAYDAIPPILAAELDEMQNAAPGEDRLAALDRDLRAEIGSFLVGLRYDATDASMTWPADHPKENYIAATLIEVGKLMAELETVIATRADPLPLLDRADILRGWTFGFAHPRPPEADHFAGRDAMVEAVLEAAAEAGDFNPPAPS